MTVRELRPSDLIEDLAVRQRAGHQGWTIDDDGWYWRFCAPADVEDEIAFIVDGKVFVPSCEEALAYDYRRRGCDA